MSLGNSFIFLLYVLNVIWGTGHIHVNVWRISPHPLPRWQTNCCNNILVYSICIYYMYLQFNQPVKNTVSKVATYSTILHLSTLHFTNGLGGGSLDPSRDDFTSQFSLPQPITVQCILQHCYIETHFVKCKHGFIMMVNVVCSDICGLGYMLRYLLRWQMETNVQGVRQIRNVGSDVIIIFG